MSLSLLLLESALTLCAIALVLLFPRFGRRCSVVCERRVGRLPAAVALAVAFLTPLAIRVALWPRLGYPKPIVMDEFSYLLGAETFASGRLANPMPPCGAAFQVPYVLSRDAFVSIYPPAQAAILAAGQRLFGHPWWGVFLSVGLMTAAAWWMARVFVPSRWALAAALATGLQFGPFSYWMNSYWGGSVAALGGFLVVGACARLRKTVRVSTACMLVLGGAILAFRRPYEGFVLVAMCLVWLAAKAWRFDRRSQLRLVLPLAGGVLFFSGVAAWYNQNTTGNWRLSPYGAGVPESSSVPIFVFGSLGHAPPQPNNLQLFEDYYKLPIYRASRSLRGFARLKAKQIWRTKGVFLRPSLIVILAVGCVALWRFRVLAAACAVAVVAVLVELPWHPHYVAPFLPLYTLVLLAGGATLWKWRRGRMLVRWVPIACAGGIVATAVAIDAGFTERAPEPEFSCCLEVFPHPRHEIEGLLEALPKQDLVLVRYGPYVNVHHEYTYNHADPRRAETVWARDLGPESRGCLEKAFPGRTVWRLDVGFAPESEPVLYRAER